MDFFASQYKEILNYWFADAVDKEWPPRQTERLWFNATAGDDMEIAQRFGSWVEAALQMELVEWERHSDSRLALILTLDQFPRHIYRSSSQAFAGDHRAATLAVEGVSRRMDIALPTAGRVFFYMPLMHAEDEDLQTMAVERFEALQRQCPTSCRDRVAASLRAAHQHREIIARFGRFPHRNRLLGRASTPQEEHFLEAGPRFGQ
ncbi:MAG: DUF924 family protein [Alcanivorax sp.]|nr:DUF924 family protein [Alcanivorax sp.]